MNDELTQRREDAERAARTDLCAACKDPDHVTCSLDPTCVCCRNTIEQMEES